MVGEPIKPGACSSNRITSPMSLYLIKSSDMWTLTSTISPVFTLIVVVGNAVCMLTHIELFTWLVVGSKFTFAIAVLVVAENKDLGSVMLLPTVAGLLKVKMLPEIDRSDNSFVASASASLGLIVLFPPFTKEINFPVASIDKSCVSCLQSVYS